MKLAIRAALIMALSVSAAMAQSAAAPVQSAAAPVQSSDVAVTIEVPPVPELPVAVNNAVLVKTKGGYLLKCSLSNSSEFRQLGLRYSLTVLDSSPRAKRVVNQSEGLALAPYQTRSVTFKTPLKLKLNGNERVILMLEQVISTDYVWDVINSKEASTAYIARDFSITPRVLRVKNQVDAPLVPRVIY